MSGAITIRKRAHGQPCPYCRRHMERNHAKLDPTRDHVTPVSRGGREVIICCAQCNHIKADMMPEPWAAFMAANPAYWLLSKADLRAARRGITTPGLIAHRNARREKRQRQGTPPVKPVVVPPELIWKPTAHPKSMTAEENARRIKEYTERQAIKDGVIWRKTARPPWNIRPERLRAVQAAHDAHRDSLNTDEEPQPSQSGEACPR